MAKTYNLQLTAEELNIINMSMNHTITAYRQAIIVYPKNSDGVKNVGSIKAKCQKLINQINDDHN